jgi:hypothetical protein
MVLRHLQKIRLREGQGLNDCGRFRSLRRNTFAVHGWLRSSEATAELVPALLRCQNELFLLIVGSPMKHVDHLQVVLVVNLVALGLAIGTAIYLALNNAGSKNMLLAIAALIGVAVAYVIQLPFELARSTSYETIGVEYTIDRAEPVIRQWVYAPTGWRVGAEIQASNWLATNNPTLFIQEAERDKIARDFLIYSLLSYITHEEFDWQLQRKSYGDVTLSQSVSKPDQCASYTATDLQQRLRQANNVFAGAPLQVLSGRLCLPPNTELDISDDTVTLRNPFCELTFKAEHPAHSIMNVDPRTREVVSLDNGEPRYEIRQMGLSIETTFFALRAQHRNSKQYHDWASRVVDGTHTWFAPGPSILRLSNF